MTSLLSQEFGIFSYTPWYVIEAVLIQALLVCGGLIYSIYLEDHKIKTSNSKEFLLLICLWPLYIVMLVTERR